MIAKLLSSLHGKSPRTIRAYPQQIKNRTISTLVDMLLAFSMQRPTLCVFEDAHWLDPSTLELIELIISRIGHARVLLIVSCRPEFRPHVVSSCEHHHTLAHSIVADRSEDDDQDLLRGWEHPPTADRPDYRKGRWRPAIHRGTDKQYVECAVTNSRLFRTHSTTIIAQGSGDAERRIDGATRPRCAEPASCPDCGCDWTRVLS